MAKNNCPHCGASVTHLDLETVDNARCPSCNGPLTLIAVQQTNTNYGNDSSRDAYKAELVKKVKEFQGA